MKDKSLEEIKRGEQAEKILNNEVYKEAFASVKEHIIDAMQTSPLSDDVTHNRLVIALQVLNQIEKSMTDIMQTGKMAKIQVNQVVK
jgi:hypothetical protein